MSHTLAVSETSQVLENKEIQSNGAELNSLASNSSEQFILSLVESSSTSGSLVYTTKTSDESISHKILVKDEDVFDLGSASKISIANLKPRTRNYFETVQKWEGRVDTISQDKFLATITDLTNKNLNDGTAEIDIDEIEEDDRVLLKKGAIFYWIVGYYFNVDGTLLSSSFIKFRRLPKVSDAYTKNLELRAKELFKNAFSKLAE